VDILTLDLGEYDVKAIKGYKGIFRLRKGDLRIIFMKEKKMRVIINIDYKKT